MSNKKIDYESEVEMLLNSRRVNDFMATYLLGMAGGGLDEELWQEGIDDAIVATELGVNSENEFYVFFYIDHFVEDLVEDIFDIKLSNDEEEELKKYLFNLRQEVDFYDFLSFRVAILHWVRDNKEKSKVAHPNVGKGFHPVGKYELRKWHDLANKITRDIVHGLPRAVAIQVAADMLDNPEKFDFLSWYKIKHERRERDKYDVNDRIKKLNRSAMAMNDMQKEGTVISDKKYYYVPKLRSVPDGDKPARPKYSEQHVQDFESVRGKIMSRVFSIDKLLEKYRKVLKEDQVDAIEESLSELRKRVRKLKLASSIQDSIVKTANLVREQSAPEIADALVAIAQEPIMPEPAPEGAPKEAPDFPESPKPKKEKKEVEAPLTPTDDLTAEQRRVVINDIVEQLESISAVIKSREIVRALSKVDILLNKLYMDTFFPELSDAMAKLIEAYSYASNKVEDILPKIKGGGVDDEGLTIPELSEESKSLAKEVSELSEQLVTNQPPNEKKKVTKEVEEAPAKGKDRSMLHVPHKQKPAKEVEEDTLRPLPEL